MRLLLWGVFGSLPISVIDISRKVVVGVSQYWDTSWPKTRLLEIAAGGQPAV